MRTNSHSPDPLAPRDPSWSYVVAELLTVGAVLAFLTALVYAPLLAVLLLGGVVGAGVATVLPRVRLPANAVDSAPDRRSAQRCTAD